MDPDTPQITPPVQPELPAAPKTDSPIPPEPTPAEEKKSPPSESPAAPAKPKRIRRKKDALAPKYARSGYNLFMRDIRASIYQRNPTDNIQEITKKVAVEWNALPEEQKRPYLEKAEEEKKRYAIEMKEYKLKMAQMEAAKDTSKDEETTPTPAKKAKPAEDNNDRPVTNGKVNGNGQPHSGSHPERTQSFSELLKKRNGDYDIPIFTDDFLEHNKALDSELRALRKSQTDYEQQNSILEKHVDNMRNGVDKLTREMDAAKETNRVLHNYLQKMREKLVDCLSGLAIPSHPGATPDNIDEYMAELQNMVTSNSHGPASLNKAKDIIRKADLHIQT